MKKYLVFLLLLIGAPVSLSAQNDDRNRDSVLLRINAIENDSVRWEYALSQQNKYIRSPFAQVLVDRLYEEARKQGDKRKEMIALFGYYNTASTTLNFKEMENALKRIEKQAYQYDLYDLYYRCKRSYLSLMASNGNMEWALNEAKKMKKEAERLNHPLGIISAQIALSEAYKFARNNLMVIETLQEVLQMEGVEDKEKISIYLSLFNSFYNLGQYREGLKYLDLQANLLTQMRKNAPNTEQALKSRFLHIETMYADTYMVLGDYNRAKEHLKRSERYYTPTCFLTYYALYHSAHARYYAHVKKWNLCFAAIDAAIERLDREQPLLRDEMMAQKAKYLEQAGRLSEAVALHREVLAAVDSLNLAFIQKQEEALAENYKWESGLVKRAQNAYLLSLASIVFIVLLLLVVAGFVVKLYWTHLQLRKAKNEAEKAEHIALESERLKNALLKNISNEIEIPLSQIKKASEKAASVSFVPTKAEVRFIEKEATNLIRLLDLVVEYSKLEVGAIRFNIRKVDILSICHQAKMYVHEHSGNKVEIHFTSLVECQLMQIDCEWMLSCLTSAMMDPDGYRLPYKLNFKVKYSDDGQQVVMEIIGSPLSDPSFSSQIQTIKNHVNNLFVKTFGGTYEVQVSELRPKLIISLPHKEE